MAAVTADWLAQAVGQAAAGEDVFILLDSLRTLATIAITTLIAIAAVVSVIGYRVFNNSGPVGFDGIITLPKGARVLSTSASAGRVAVLIDINGASELRTFDIKTLKQTGRLQFATEP